MSPKVEQDDVEPAAKKAAAWTGQVWLLAVLPLVLLAVLIAIIVRSGPAEGLQGEGIPPVERITFQRVELTGDGIVADVLNDGPDPVTIAQVQVDDAYWNFSIEPDSVLRHLGRATVRIPYPWVEGDTHVVRVVTATGVTADYEIPVAVRTPEVSGRFLWVFTLIGIYVGVIPVALGLLWYPMVARLGRAGFDFLLALTVGLLMFLLVDAVQEGMETAAEMPESYQGVALFAFAALAAYLGLEALGQWLRRGRAAAGLVLALLIAVGIGLHNLGEGLAIGAAFSLGEAALGTLLIIGFTLHNTTEGLAIVSPLARADAERRGRMPIGQLIKLGLIGGVPTIAGAWIGGFVYSRIWALMFLGIGAGAIAQVVGQIVNQMAGDRPLARYLATTPVLGGLLVGFVVMYATGMLIG